MARGRVEAVYTWAHHEHIQQLCFFGDSQYWGRVWATNRMTGFCVTGRYGQPAEVAGMVRFLAIDPSAAYITGQTLNVDGGMVMF